MYNVVSSLIIVPPDFSSTLMRYTKQGLRVIAAATKSLSPKVQWKEADEMVRADLEEKAEFLGLIVMQNSVKEETFPAIKELHEADIVTVMVTGKQICNPINQINKTKYVELNFKIS